MAKATRITKRNLRGRGDYSEEIKNNPKPFPRLEAKIDHLERSLVHATPNVNKAASSAGRALGSMFGQGDLGALAGGSLAKLFGHGDYSVKSNTLMSSMLSGPTVPAFSNKGRRGVRITEREFLGDIVSGALVSGSTVFTNTSFPIIPTDPNTFPWLSVIASNFDQWEPLGIVFEFVSTSSEFNGANQSLGSVILATEYDVRDSNYTSKQDMANSDYACSTRPAVNLVHGVECAPSERPTKLLFTDQTGTQTLNRLGNFQVATQGMSASGIKLGELWVSYDIAFYKKQLSNSTSSSATWIGFATATTGLFASPSLLFEQPAGVGNYTLTQNVGVGSVLNFGSSIQSGRFLLVYTLDSNVNTNDTMAGWTYSNCNLVTLQNFTTAGSFGLTGYSLVDITGGSATITTTLKFTTNATWRLQVNRVPTTYRFQI